MQKWSGKNHYNIVTHGAKTSGKEGTGAPDAELGRCQNEKLYKDYKKKEDWNCASKNI